MLDIPIHVTEEQARCVLPSLEWGNGCSDSELGEIPCDANALHRIRQTSHCVAGIVACWVEIGARNTPWKMLVRRFTTKKFRFQEWKKSKPRHVFVPHHSRGQVARVRGRRSAIEDIAGPVVDFRPKVGYLGEGVTVKDRCYSMGFLSHVEKARRPLRYLVKLRTVGWAELALYLGVVAYLVEITLEFVRSCVGRHLSNASAAPLLYCRKYTHDCYFDKLRNILLKISPCIIRTSDLMCEMCFGQPAVRSSIKINQTPSLTACLTVSRFPPNVSSGRPHH